MVTNRSTLMVPVLEGQIVTENRDEESGEYSEQYCDDEFINAVSSLDLSTTNNIADRVGCSYNLAYRRLQTLLEDGLVEKSEVGGSFLWHMKE